MNTRRTLFILVALCLLLVKGSLSRGIQPFKTGDISLYASFNNQGKQIKTFQVSQQYQQRDQIAFTIKDFNLQDRSQRLFIKKLAWEVKCQSPNNILLEVTQSQSKSQSYWTIQISYLVILEDYLRKIITMQTLRIGQKTDIRNLDNQMLLTFSSKKSLRSKNIVGNHDIYILYRGFQMKQKSTQFDIAPVVNLQGYFVTNQHLQIYGEIGAFKYCFITLMIVNRAQLSRFNIQITLSPFSQFDNDNEWPTMTLLTNVSIQSCNQKSQGECWQMKSQRKIMKFTQTSKKITHELQHQIFLINENDDEEFSLHGRNRLLSGCSRHSCSCTGFAFATECFEDNSCKCKIQTCANGYYTTSSLVDKCTICPTNLTNCVSCGLKTGSKTAICNKCVGGYTPINGICTVCPLGCLTCTTILVNKVLTFSCDACVSNLTQSSGSAKTCECSSNQFINTSVTPVTCTTCPASCQACTGTTTCTSCKNGYYLLGSSCLACMPVCKTCTTSSTCTTCLSTSFTFVGSVCACSASLFFDITTKSCRSCTALKSNCLTCDYSAPYDPSNPSSVICIAAKTGYALVAGSAVACISYCADCNLTPSPLCSTPQTNFTFDGTSCVCSVGNYFLSGKCLICSEVITGCTTCQTNAIPALTTCTACDPNGFFGPTTPSTCTACPSLCTSCNAENDCTHCINNLSPISGVCTCDSNVNQFYNSATKSCLSCSATIFNCQVCASTATSVTCTTCVTGTYRSANGLTCYPCPATCSDCSSSTVCTGCQSGYELASGACTCGTNCTDCMTMSTGLCASCSYTPFTCLSCVVGYQLSGSSCLACNLTWPSCTECSSSACLGCQSPFIIQSSGCACNNTAGLYLSLDSTQCLTCSSIIPQCTTCTPISTTCTACSAGYYISSSTSCAACSGNCQTCNITATTCLTCLVTYSMVLANTCACDNAGGYFYDPGTTGCNHCPFIIPNCQTCVSNLVSTAQCSLCVSLYFWNTSTSTCDPCSSSCSSCSNLLVCTSCPNGLALSETIGWTVSGLCVCDNTTLPLTYYDIQSGSCQSCSYIYPSCSSCSIVNISGVICNACISSAYLSNNQCVNCPSSCATCNAIECLSCPGNMTLNSGACICDSSCAQCQSFSVGCLSCSIISNAINACYTCSPGMYLNSPNCMLCPSSCATCSSSTTCLTCQPTYVLIGGMCSCATSLGIFPSGTGTCSPCSQLYYSCTQCSSSSGNTICIECAPGYFVSGNSCLPCNTNCLTCSGAANTCTSCATGQTLNNATCACTSSSCLACDTISPNCVECIYTIYGNFSKCETCKSGYYINGNNCSPCPSSCNTCGANGICLTCPATFEVINGTCLCDTASSMFQTGGICLLCTSIYPNCQTCSQNATNPLNVTCLSCNYGYYFVSANNSCEASVCGDGFITSGQICDDGNTNSGDGCSIYCQVQSNFLCTGAPSLCSVNVNFKITLNSIETSKITCNRVSIGFKLYPVYDDYMSTSFQSMLSYVSQANLKYVDWSYSKGVVTYVFDYTTTLNNANVTFYFAPSSLSINQTSSIPLIFVIVQLVPTNNIAIIYYDESVCASKANIQGLTNVIEYTSYGALVLSSLPCKIVGLQLFGVLQLAHINVGNMDYVNTMMTPLMGLKGVHGFTANLGQESSKSSRLLQTSTPSRVQSIGYQSNFLRNCNVMLFVVVVIILVSVTLYICTYCCRKCAPALHKISKRIIKEVLLTLILFNCFNFAYSAGLHFNYAATDDSLYAVGTVAAVLSIILPVIMALGIMCTEDQGFGEYKEKFKPGLVQRLYFVVTILYRTGIGLYISTTNEDSMSTMIVMALSIAFLLYNLINLPYKKAYHNYRANICHITQFICLFVAMYYRSMMSSTSKTAMATVFSPVYLQIICILISLIVSLIVLVYEIYLFVKECMRNKKVSSRASRITQSSCQNELEKAHSLADGNLEFQTRSKEISIISMADTYE